MTDYIGEREKGCIASTSPSIVALFLFVLLTRRQTLLLDSSSTFASHGLLGTQRIWSRPTWLNGCTPFRGLRLSVASGRNFPIRTRTPLLLLVSSSPSIFRLRLISGHVLAEDTFYRTITDDQVLITKRILAKTNKMPRWGEKLFSRGSSSAIAFILEESICDLKQKLFTTTTVNLNLRSLMVNVDESLVIAHVNEILS